MTSSNEARKSILFLMLTREAIDLLNRIAMVKESKARELESRLIMMARSNQLRQRVTQDDLISFIRLLDEKKEEEKVVFSRRKGAFDHDDDNLLDLRSNGVDV
ncbi:hypothetical protein RUND412_009621 [Rhizina undulata]